MKLYHNIMEDLVEEYYDDVASRQNICTCERCRNDTIALALSMLPAHYAVTSVGNKLSKLNSLRRQASTDLQAAMFRSIDIVAASPRHDDDEFLVPVEE
ncbi:MAG: late competence development ComFB family protein [Oscillospiraceae bacterium]|nr:late competence development ComFB family protein [Oscillospiraceae bacterium]